MRWRTRIAASITALLVFSSCGLWTKQRQAESIYQAHDKAIESKTASGVLHLIYIPQPDDNAQEEEGQGAAQRTVSAKANFELDFARESAKLTMTHLTAPTAPGEGEAEAQPVPETESSPRPQPEQAAQLAPTEAGTVFHGGTVFVRRANLRSAGRRVWAKLDFDKLDDDEPKPSSDSVQGARYIVATFNTVSPLYLFDLVLGALPGSVRSTGKEKVGDVETTKYFANISIERSINELELDDEALETRTLMFNLLGVYQDVRPGGFWIDDQGRVRRISMSLMQVVSRTERNFLIMSMEINSYGQPVEFPNPSDEETVEVERYARLVRIAVP